ncbi:hypothetical protein GCM10009674_29570 [Nesterenkonia xinjiangensis]
MNRVGTLQHRSAARLSPERLWGIYRSWVADRCSDCLTDRGLGLGWPGDAGRGALGLNRIGLEVFDVNPRACHVDENVGFVHEGTERQA